MVTYVDGPFYEWYYGQRYDGATGSVLRGYANGVKPHGRVIAGVVDDLNDGGRNVAGAIRGVGAQATTGQARSSANSAQAAARKALFSSAALEMFAADIDTYDGVITRVHHKIEVQVCQGAGWGVTTGPTTRVPRWRTWRR